MVDKENKRATIIDIVANVSNIASKENEKVENIPHWERKLKSAGIWEQV